MGLQRALRPAWSNTLTAGPYVTPLDAPYAMTQLGFGPALAGTHN